MSLQTEQVPFWPTEICGAGPNRICVAGKTVKGKTRIQLWEFSATEVLEDPFQDPQTGQWIYPETYLPIETKTQLYHDAQPGKGLVRTMLRNHGSTNEVFVQFEDSRDLYALNLDTHALDLRLSANAQPALLQDNADRFASDHLFYGLLYLFCSGAEETLILVDADTDGQLDQSETMLLDAEEWAQVFEDQSAFVEVF